MSHTIDALLGPGGALARSLAGYEHRPSQLEVARAVERAFHERSFLLAEAGTGTGKTLAYLVPAVLSGRRVVVSTATKNLQEQIFFKDIPLLCDHLKLPFGAAYLKGRSNYLCAHRFEAFEKQPVFPTAEEAKLWPKLRDWALRTETGDRAESGLPDGFGAWKELSTTTESCLGAKCPLYEPCFVTQNRRRAEAVELLIVNHHLFFADLALKTRKGGNEGTGVLPPYEAVIFDEAHALESIATEYFGVHVSSHRLEELVRDALKAPKEADERAGLLSALAVTVRGRAEDFFEDVRDRFGLKQDSAVRLVPSAFQSLSSSIDALQESLRALWAVDVSEEEPELFALRRRAGELSEELDFVTRANRSDQVFWAEARGRGVFLKAAPIDVSQALSERLYQATDTAIFTSATLTAGGRFDFVSRRLGLFDGEERRVRTLSVRSPFDYASQVVLYVPPDLPEPQAPGFVEAVADRIIELCDITGGRAFALFTSLRNMEAAWRLARHRLPYQVLKQGERPKHELLQLFQEEPSVLFASHSFWEGVDVPGAALSLVVMDKLPFSSPTEPLIAARLEHLREQGEDAFSSYQVPEAAISLRQGFGRLIRTRTDRGIVALLDTRVRTRRYGRAFLESLPRTRREEELSSVRRWFEQVRVPEVA